jgi:hypothetical protein
MICIGCCAVRNVPGTRLVLLLMPLRPMRCGDKRGSLDKILHIQIKYSHEPSGGVDGGGVGAVESANGFAIGDPSPPEPELLSSSSAASSACKAMAGMHGVWL